MIPGKQRHGALTVIRKKVQLQVLCAVASLIALIGVCVTSHVAVAQPLQMECYPLDALTVDDEYFIGDSFEATNATINITPYFRNGEAASPDNPSVQRAWVRSSMIAGGNAPELRAYLVNVQVVPDTPAQGVSMRYGRTGGTRFANLAVNGELTEIDGSMTDVDNRVLGSPLQGRVLVRVTPDNTDHESGTIELFPLTGAIHRFAVGGVPHYLDDVCLTY